MGSGDKKRKTNNKKKGKKQHEDPMITDERFKAAESDPRFMEVSTKKSKVAVDSRFNRLFNEFSTSKAPVDKRGKPYKNKKKRKAAPSILSHYYREQEEEDEKKNKAEEDDDSEKGDEESFSGSDDEKLITAVEDDTDGTTDSESEFESGDVDEEGYAFEQPVENIPDIDKETRRLAVVNMDWTHVRAVDLFVSLDSFLPKHGRIILPKHGRIILPKHGRIKSVTVYPTEFGLKRMEEEAVRSPIGLFSDDEKEDEDDGDVEEDKENEDGDGDNEKETENEDDDDGEQEKENEEDDDDGEMEKENEDDDDDEMETESEDEDDDDVNGIDNKKIRAYELSKLRYYYAVVECDSVATADFLYQTCDGVEFERSGITLDLRFIPDTMEFKHQPRIVKPANYEGFNFNKPPDLQIPWDEDDPFRLGILKKLLKSDQPAESELNEVLATDESETDDEIADVGNDKLQKKRKRQDKYLALLQSGNGSDEDDEEDNDQDMVVTFNSGLDDISKRILENKDKKSKTVWEATLRKKKEKKKALRKRSKYSSDDESGDNDYADREIGEQPGDFFVEDNQVHDTKAEESVKEAEKSRAELELLLTDVNGEKSKAKEFKLKPKKKGKKDKDDTAEKLPTIDYSDPRFSAHLNKPNFALDPTDPQFKRTAAYAKQVTQKDTKGSMVNVRETDHLVNSDKASEVGEVENVKNGKLAKTKESHELSTLVRSVKMKSKLMPLQSERKVQRNHKLKANLQK